jgi:hypothetical protein
VPIFVFLIAMLVMAAPARAQAILISTDKTPSEINNQRVDWAEIPDLVFDCEGGVEITVSHASQQIWVSGGSGIGWRMTGSSARYEFERDQFQSPVIAIAIDDVVGTNWELNSLNGSSVWYFRNGRKTSNCLPAPHA